MAASKGLVVGKFAPLHLGHEALIAFALQHCDEVLVMSYTSQTFERCDIGRRARWLQQRCPNVRVLVFDEASLAGWAGFLLPFPGDDASDEVQRDFIAAVCRHHGFLPDTVFSSEGYGPGLAARLSQRFGHAVRHHAFDPARLKCPVSATQIRANPHACRSWLSGEVYADFVERIALLGGESTGKSTLAAALADRLDTAYASEFGREHWHARSGQLNRSDLHHIARSQVRREEAIARNGAQRYLVCDTTPLTTLGYAFWMFGERPAELEAIAARHYDHVFLLAPDFPFVQDGTRVGDAFRQQQHAWHLDELERRGQPFTLLGGPLDIRLSVAVGQLHTGAASQ
ncbi:AAA family ATPase [Chitinibacteraceae bacterium HSL-7]